MQGGAAAAEASSSAAAAASPFDLFGQETTTAAPADEIKPLIGQNDSVFVVTVEFIKLVDKRSCYQSNLSLFSAYFGFSFEFYSKLCIK